MTRSLGLNRWSRPISNGLANEENGRGGGYRLAQRGRRVLRRFLPLFDEQTSKERGEQLAEGLEQGRSVAEEAEDQGDRPRDDDQPAQPGRGLE